MKKVGLALSSGGARGLAHIGVIKVLEENKVPIDCIAGTSIGAIVGAYYALYGQIKGLEEVALGFKKTDLIKLADFNDPRVSLVKGMKAKDFLYKIFGNKTFDDTKIPLKIGATALEDCSKVVFTEGKLLDAIMASSTLPGIFPVTEHNGIHLIDGGLADATPVDLVGEADVIIAVDLFNLEYNRVREYRKSVDVLERTYELLMARLADYSEREYENNTVILKPKTGKGMQMLDFFLAKENILAGENEARKHIEKIKQMIK